jgi:hypothetical protein
MTAIHKSGLIIALLFLEILHHKDIHAQQYQLLPDSNASWFVQERSSEYTLHHYWFLSDFHDDTTINNKEYTKVFEKPGWTNDLLYTGAFRNDSSGKTYFIPYGDMLEVLLQDFTKQKGDTVYNVAVHLHDYIGAYDFVVDSVMYLPCGPYNLRWIELHNIEMIPSICGTSLHWMEKIGNISGGIFNQPEIGLNVFSLICQSASDTIFYNAYSGGFPQSLIYYPGNCDYLLNTDKLISDDSITIYPNPFESAIHIRSEYDFIDVSINIYDLMGRLLISERMYDFSSPYTTKVISNLKSGNYFILISTKHKQLWKQIITKM